MDKLWLSMPVSDFFGAGTCGKHLLREFARRYEVAYDASVSEAILTDEQDAQLLKRHAKLLISDVADPLLQLADYDLGPNTQYRGTPNAAYVFFEDDKLTKKQKDNLKAFDILIAGSQWNADILKAEGFTATAVPQGVDRSVFRPFERPKTDRFMIFSGGKLEHRKAQDLVARAVKILQVMHPDILLVALWMNPWQTGNPYQQAVEMGIEMMGMKFMTHEQMANVMNLTDVGLFPNRCEGGTNLVMMEYLACGKPVVAAYTTGQKDVLDPTYAGLLTGSDDERVGMMVEQVEALYRNRDRLKEMGCAADAAMNQWSWSRTAEGIASAINQRIAH